jgi:hypothetical protein
MTEKKPKVLVSTDIGGLVSDLSVVEKVYAAALPALQGQLLAEVIAWRHLSEKAVKNAPFKTTGIHGQVGIPSHEPGIEKPIMWTTGHLMQSTKDLIQLPEDHPLAAESQYLLIHEPEADREDSIIYLQRYSEKPSRKHVLIENILRPGSLKKAKLHVYEIDAVGGSAGMMIDLVHLMKEIIGEESAFANLKDLGQHQFDSTWKKTLELTRDMLGQIARSGIHLPIGVNSDSLPIAKMRKHHWQDLATLLKETRENVEWIVLENQQANPLFTSKREIPKIADRNQRIASMLAEYGVI